MKLIVSTLVENKKKINELIEGFSKAIGKDFCKNDVLDFLHKVSFYTENFFINEEIFLKKYKLPTYQEHVDQHNKFVKKMVYFQEKLEGNNLEICKELLDYLIDWHKFHVLKNDNEIIEFIEKNK
jgi:hemerythrin